MKTVVAILIIVVAVPLLIFLYKSTLERSKSTKTSLWGSFNNEFGPEDNLGKMTPSALDGLEEAKRDADREVGK